MRSFIPYNISRAFNHFLLLFHSIVLAFCNIYRHVDLNNDKIIIFSNSIRLQLLPVWLHCRIINIHLFYFIKKIFTSTRTKTKWICDVIFTDVILIHPTFTNNKMKQQFALYGSANARKPFKKCILACRILTFRYSYVTKVRNLRQFLNNARHAALAS